MEQRRTDSQTRQQSRFLPRRPSALVIYDPPVTTLAPSGPSGENLETLRARVAERETALAERAAEAERLDADLTLFAARYRHQVGTLHEQLDQIHLEIADAELDILSSHTAAREAREETSTGRADPPPPPPDAASAPRLTSDAVRKLFRDVARAIHPDLAPDEDARTRRHAIMAAANRAYALGDADELRRILEGWAQSPDQVTGLDAAAIRLRFERRLIQIDGLMEMYAREQAELEATPLYQLKVSVDEATARGRDLMADMVTRLERDIMAATNRLEAMRFTP
jgi:hypothetical protein